MAGFSGFVSYLPSISLKVLEFKFIKSAIKAFLSQTAFMSATQWAGPAQSPFFRLPMHEGYSFFILTDPTG